MIAAVLAVNLEGVQAALQGETDRADRAFRGCLSGMLRGNPPVFATPPIDGRRAYYVADVPQASAEALLLPVLFDGRPILGAVKPKSKKQAMYVASAVVTYNLATTTLLAQESTLARADGAASARPDTVPRNPSTTTIQRTAYSMYRQAGRLLARVLTGRNKQHEHPLLALLHVCLVSNLAACRPSDEDLVRRAFVSLTQQPTVPQDLVPHAQEAFRRFAPRVLPGASWTAHGAGAA